MSSITSEEFLFTIRTVTDKEVKRKIISAQFYKNILIVVYTE